MKALVVGGGGREHALAWKLSQSKLVSELHCVPGNPGTAHHAVNHAIPATDCDAIVRCVKSNGVELVVIGPEQPLADGLANLLQSVGVAVFGPVKEAARLETSKHWAKQLMLRNGVPTADYKLFDDLEEAQKHIAGRDPAQYVIKLDGLAAGKGVFLPKTAAEAKQMLAKAFTMDKTVLIEDRLSGTEVSVFGFVSDDGVSDLMAACDYKRLRNGDKGPNTGGMGCYTSPAFWNNDLAQKVRDEVFLPVIAGLQADGISYRGVLYAGLIITPDGVRVLEFNCRFGDPECQALMPLIAADLGEVCWAVAGGKPPREVRLTNRHFVGVVAVSDGYPGEYSVGKRIDGADGRFANNELDDTDPPIFHSGTKKVDGDLVTAGGRVLTVVAGGTNSATARKRCYERLERVSFDGMRFRTDIAVGL